MIASLHPQKKGAEIHKIIPMGRKEKIARSIVQAITRTTNIRKRPGNLLASILAFLTTLFSLYHLVLRRIRPADFAKLRRQHWDINDNDYAQSFQQEDGDEVGKPPLKAIGDMGFSGSVGCTRISI